MRISDLKQKEVINICDCKRLGYVGDVDFDMDIKLNSPSNMFIVIPLRSKSILRNSGRICLVPARKETSGKNQSHHPPP